MAAVFVASIGIYAGTDFAQTFVLEDSQSNSIMDLTGFTGCAELKKYESSSKVASFNVSLANDPTTGRISISMTDAVTATIKPGRYLYDVLISSATGKTTRVVEGSVMVKKPVTR
tara:strand:+ start:225 stop:569 length:345 start_codon:yes stop_codon:yes gene_type:complete